MTAKRPRHRGPATLLSGGGGGIKTPQIRYSPNLARRICDLIAEGESLKSIADMTDMPARRTVRGWLNIYPDFERQYEIARRERTDNLVDEAIEIADSVSGCTDNAKVQAARLAIDTRRWLASKLLPERFSEHSRVELTGKEGQALIPPAETDPQRIAIAMLALLNSARGGRNDPSRPAPIPAYVAPTKLLPAVAAEAETVTAPAEPETYVGEQSIPVFGEVMKPLFSRETGKIIRLVRRGGEQGYGGDE